MGNSFNIDDTAQIVNNINKKLGKLPPNIGTFKPFITREELLSKNIVEIKKNHDLEFGYAMCNGNTDVIFCETNDTHACLMLVPQERRHYFLSKDLMRNFPFDELKLKDDAFLKPRFLDSTVKHANETKDYSVVDACVGYLEKFQPTDYETLKSRYSLYYNNDKFSYSSMGQYMFQNFCDDVVVALPTDYIWKMGFMMMSINTILENERVCEFLDSTNLASPFDEVVVKHYIADGMENFEPNAEIYTHFKIVDREKNIVTASRYAYSPIFKLWIMPAYGTYVMGHNASDGKKAIRKGLKTTHFDSSLAQYGGTEWNDCILPYDYLSYIYAWYKCLRNRDYEIREVTAKAKKEESLPKSKKVKREYVESATKNERRVINLGGKVVVYTKDATAVKSIKKRSVTWHVDEFFRRGTECHYHRKDGKITVYKRKGSTVRPKKNMDTQNSKGVTYVVK